jgi:hypothetical protein
LGITLLAEATSTQRRLGGKENPMKLSLRNLLRNLTGTGAARKRSTPTTRLQVEQLEQRLVPTVNLSSMEIASGNGKGVPFVQTEQINGAQATYQGLVNEALSHEQPPQPVHPSEPVHPSAPIFPMGPV